MTSQSQLYPLARQLFGTARLNWPTSNIKILLMAQGYTPNFANQYLSDVQAAAAASIIATSPNIGTPTATNGFLSGSTVNFGVISSSLIAASLLFYQDTGTPSTSVLIGYLDTPDVAGLPAVLNGLSFFLYQNLNYGGWFRL